MLYQIKEQIGAFPFRLFFSKKNGLKLKKSFRSREQIEWFVKDYLRYCCLRCQQRGWIYKTRGSNGLRGGIRGPYKRAPAKGSIMVCPECQAKHRISFESQQIQGWAYNNKGAHPRVYTVQHIVLELMPD